MGDGLQSVAGSFHQVRPFAVTRYSEALGSPNRKARYHLAAGGRHQRRTGYSAGPATLSIASWGVFTIGVEADGGQTRFELDLPSVSGGTTALLHKLARCPCRAPCSALALVPT
jgi:hypothetical protein